MEDEEFTPPPEPSGFFVFTSDFGQYKKDQREEMTFGEAFCIDHLLIPEDSIKKEYGSFRAKKLKEEEFLMGDKELKTFNQESNNTENLDFLQKGILKLESEGKRGKASVAQEFSTPSPQYLFPPEKESREKGKSEGGEIPLFPQAKNEREKFIAPESPKFPSQRGFSPFPSEKQEYNAFFLYELDTVEKILSIIHKVPLSIEEIAEIIGLAKKTIYNTIVKHKLEEKGLIEADKKWDKKVICTEEGKKIVNNLMIQFNRYRQEIKTTSGSLETEDLMMEHITELLYSREALCVEAKRKKVPLRFDFFDFVRYLPSPTLFSEYLLDKPEDAIKIIQASYFSKYEWNPKVRIYNLPNSSFIPIGDIRISHQDSFVKLKGIPIGASRVFSRVAISKFECLSCGMVRRILQPDHDYIIANRCGCGSRSKQKEIGTEQKDVQIVKVEECAEEMGKRTQPQHINVILEYDLTNTNLQHHLEESKKLIINGVIKTIKRNDKKDANSNYFVLYANSVELEVPEESELSKEDIKMIERMAEDKDIIPKIVSSFCPEIIDRDREKEMLLLSAVSGGGKNFGIRDDSHVLLVGDPSLGKSFLLRGLKDLFPIARWVSGNNTSGVGLIGTVKKDEQLGETMLVKGAITMANGGLVLVDELDKMRPEDRLALHEPLENQFVVLNKWDKHAEFKADCTMIAACNPKFSRFTDGEIITQINLPPTLISRFDIVIIMKDRINRSTDERIAKAVFQRISRKKEAISETIPLPLLQKYLDYARRKEPILSPETYKIIESYYVEIREKVGINLGMTARQMEGLVRIAHARAKLRLSPIVTKEDADNAIQIMTFFLKQIATDHLTGNVDVDLIYEGIAGSERTMLQFLREAKKIRYEDFYSRFSIPQPQMEKIIEKWSREGTILLNRDWLIYNG